jgi:hypothetical protein
MAPKYHPTPLSGGDRKALTKELGKARAMANILAAQSAEMRVFDVFNYVSEQVRRTVPGRQHPIFKASDLEDNFPVALDRGGSKAVPVASVTDKGWRDIEDIMADLYPAGPTDQAIWARAGGDVSRLTLSGTGRANWFAALRTLKLGGGGKGITRRALLTSERLAMHAHEDIPALTRQAKTLMAADPDFLVEIFGVVFGFSVTDQSSTSMGASQILPLTSNKRQDYDHAKWELKEVVPRFLETQPELAIQAISAALEGYVRRKYGDVKTIDIPTVGGTITLIEDHSYIWASDPNDRHAHSDNAAAMLLAFTKLLEAAEDGDAVILANHVIRHARPAVLWARLFLVGARRASVLGAVLWPYASEVATLRASDTTKDAVDLVAAVYPLVDEADRKLFEENAFAIQYPNSTDPERSRLRFLGTLFGTIGAAHLATDQARRLVEEAAEKAVSTENRRPIQFTSTNHPAEPFYWLAEHADIKAPPNAALLRLVEQMDAEAGGLPRGLAAAEALSAAITAADPASVAARVKEHAEDQLGYALAKMAGQQEALKQNTAAAERLWSLASPYLRHPRPADVPGSATDMGPRVSSVETALRLCAISQALADTIFPEVAALTNDPNAAVRFSIADKLGLLWDFRRDDLWRIAEQYIVSESSSDVLRAITGLLCRAVNHDLQKVEDLTLLLSPRAALEEDSHGDRIVEGIASIVAVLWTRYERPRARRLITTWLAEPEKHQGELQRIISTMRGHIVDGYTSGKSDDIKLRESVQRLAGEIVEHAATYLDEFYAKPNGYSGEPERERVRFCARLVDHVGDQLYFSCGAAADTDPPASPRLTNTTARSESRKRCGDRPTSITPQVMLFRCLPKISLSNTFTIMFTPTFVAVSGSRAARYSSKVGGSSAFFMASYCA